jgi:hypothetical protein
LVPEYQLQEGLYEYSSELCIYLRQLEERFVLHKDFLEGGSINQGMRAMVVNWIIEVRQFPSVFRIHDFLEWIRIRGSMPLTNGSGSGSWIRILLFSSLTFKMPTKNNFCLKKFFSLLLIEGTFT